MCYRNMNSEAIDKLRVRVDSLIDKKSELGQFMPPPSIANFMSDIFDKPSKSKKILDCGAGQGSLSLSAVKKLISVDSLEVWEIDASLKSHLKKNLNHLSAEVTIHSSDLIQDAVSNILKNKGTRFTHAILNPPYKKIKSDCIHRTL